ncbi:MAG TPA: hypothetical protein VNH11_33050 [Pirellulales bacterium]|nr:hypothetical protein [Pirellulales bacterium]
MPAQVFFRTKNVEGGATAPIVCKTATTQQERAGAFRLLYEAYVKAGLMAANGYQMRVTVHHLLPTTTLFVAVQADEVVATISLIGDGRLGLPMECVYGPDVQRLREPACWLGEVSCLACRERQLFSRLDMLVSLMGLTPKKDTRNLVDAVAQPTFNEQNLFRPRRRLGREKGLFCASGRHFVRRADNGTSLPKPPRAMRPISFSPTPTGGRRKNVPKKEERP